MVMLSEFKNSRLKVSERKKHVPLCAAGASYLLCFAKTKKDSHIAEMFVCLFVLSYATGECETEG